MKVNEKTVLANIQRILEDTINEGNVFVHPYCLNLDTLTNCLNGLVKLGALDKIRRQVIFIYLLS